MSTYFLESAVTSQVAISRRAMLGSFSVERRDNQSQAVLISLDGDGNFVDAPEGFFQEGYNEALGIAQAAFERKKIAKKKKRNV